MGASAIPAGFNSVSSYIVVKDVPKAVEFYKKAFDARPGTMMYVPGTKDVMHAEMRVGNSTIMLSQENPQWHAVSAETLGGSPISIHLYVENADKSFERAVKAGCQVAAPLMDAFWGDRYGKVKDPFGLQWGIATHVEDVPEHEMGERAAKWWASMSKGDCQ